MNEPSVAELIQAAQRIREQYEPLRQANEEPVTVDSQGFIQSGTVWIPPFAYDCWSRVRKKPTPTICIWTSCGKKHTLKGA